MLTPADHDKSLEAIYEDEFRYQTLIHNHMVKMFSLTTGEMTDGALTPMEFTPSHLDSSQAASRHSGLFGLQEHFKSSAKPAATIRLEPRRSLHANRTEPVDCLERPSAAGSRRTTRWTSSSTISPGPVRGAPELRAAAHERIRAPRYHRRGLRDVLRGEARVMTSAASDVLDPSAYSPGPTCCRRTGGRAKRSTC